MSGRALVFSFSPPPLSSRRISSHVINHATSSLFPLHLLSRRRGGGGGKVWADVKSSEKHVPDSSGNFLQKKKKSRALADLEEEEEAATSSSAWWQVFPKRWVIVILCFSAFLLCNMDRVSAYAPFFKLHYIKFVPPCYSLLATKVKCN